MPAASDAWLLDTSALLCLRQNEAGASEVERIVRSHGKDERVFVSFVSLMEFYYVVQRKEGESEARRAYLQLKQLPLRVVESDEELGLASAKIKAASKLSFADAWIAATAQRLDAALVHKDPEFDQVQGALLHHRLPYKR